MAPSFTSLILGQTLNVQEIFTVIFCSTWPEHKIILMEDYLAIISALNYYETLLSKALLHMV